MRFPDRLVAPVALTAALALFGPEIAACGAGAPPLEKPNGTLEVVLNNLGGYALTGLHRSQDVRISFAPDDLNTKRSTLRFWNFTHSQIDPETLLGMADSFDYDAAENSDTLTFSVPTGDTKDPYITVQATTEHNVTVEHDVLVLPENTTPPPDYDEDLLGETHMLNLMTPGVSQTISIVKRPTDDYGNILRITGLGSALPVEICQALVKFVPVNGNRYPKIDPILLDRLTQEEGCNSYGNAESSILVGDTYNQYVHDHRIDSGEIDIGYKVYSFKDFKVSYGVFQRMKQRLLGGNG